MYVGKFGFKADSLFHGSRDDRQSQVPTGDSPAGIGVCLGGQAEKKVQKARSHVGKFLRNVRDSQTWIIGLQGFEIIVPGARKIVGDHPCAR